MRLLALILLFLCTGCAAPLQAPVYAYQVYLPQGYDSEPGRSYPLILFLHGANSANPSGKLIASFLQAHSEFPFILVAPTSGEGWSAPRLDTLLQEVEPRLRIDPKRRYLTGLSMGARGAAALGARMPQHFAAIALIAGAGDAELACALRRVPVRLVHNRADDIVPLADSQRYDMVLRSCGGKVNLIVNETLKPGQWPHDAWTDVYTTPELYRWFLSKGG